MSDERRARLEAVQARLKVVRAALASGAAVSADVAERRVLTREVGLLEGDVATAAKARDKARLELEGLRAAVDDVARAREVAWSRPWVVGSCAVASLLLAPVAAWLLRTAGLGLGESARAGLALLPPVVVGFLARRFVAPGRLRLPWRIR